MTSKRRKANPPKDDPPAKRASKGRAAKKQDNPVWATENAKSHLVSQDLHAKYSDPSTYKNWTREDWEEIHDSLPENVAFNEDGYSVQINYFKYDPDWRRLVREFQEDLEAGRYEPEWQEQASRAMEERAAGKFDKHKEDQFEAFWGQKQTSKRDDYAGESAKVKLSQLVGNGLIKVGDALSYRRTFRLKDRDPLMIEKELRVVSIDGTTLTVAIPPRQLKYHKSQNSVRRATNVSIECLNAEKKIGQEKGNARVAGIGLVAKEKEKGDDDATTSSEMYKGAIAFQDDATDGLNPLGARQLSILPTNSLSSEQDGIPSADDAGAADGEKPASNDSAGTTAIEQPTINGTVKYNHNIYNHLTDTEIRDQEHMTESTQPKPAVKDAQDLAAIEKVAVKGSGQALSSDALKGHVDPDTGSFLYEVWKPNGLENKIIQIDGRMDPNEAPIASSWRFIRVQRNNQDLGSLFDLREEFYVWKSPKIVKTPKKSRDCVEVQVDEQYAEGSKEQPTKARGTTKKRALDDTPPSNTNSKRSRSARASQEINQNVNHDNYDIQESGNEDNAAETNSDNNFAMNGPRSADAKSKSGSKRCQGRPRNIAKNREDAVEDVDQAEVQGSRQRPKAKQIKDMHFCEYCNKGFTSDWSMRRHIRDTCKNAPGD